MSSAYFPEVAWSTLATNVMVGSTTYRYKLTVNYLDPNEPGAISMVMAVGDWFIDYAGFPFIIEEIVGNQITVYDINERGDGVISAYGPYPDKIGYVYRPKNGAIILTQAQLRKLDVSASDIIYPIEKGIIWKYRGINIIAGASDIENITKVELQGIGITSVPNEGWQGGNKAIVDLTYTYPSQGIVTSTGTGWGTSIVPMTGYMYYNGTSWAFKNESYLLDTGDTATGDYTFDTNTLIIDSVNHRVGFGTSPTEKVDVSGNIRTTGQLISTVATGTAPLSVLSTTLVSNLNTDLLDGQHGSYYLPVSSYTAADVLAKIKTVDGTGSGLDADLLDGLHKTSFGASLGVSGNDIVLKNSDATVLSTITVPYATNADLLDNHDSSYFQVALTNPVTGTGTVGYIPKFTGVSAIGNSPIYTNGIKVSIGNTTPGAILDLAGTMLVNRESVAYYRNVIHKSSAVVTGTLKITLPKGWSNTMMKMRIEGYNYTGGARGTSWSVIVGSYNYSGSSQWVNCFAEIQGAAPFNTVRLGYDGVKNVILIGNTTTSWSYPKVVVAEFMAGHSNTIGWDTGWAIDWITDETEITNIVTPVIDIFRNTTGNVGIKTTNPLYDLTLDGKFGILEGGATPTYYTILQGGDQTGNITYTLPTSAGLANQVLSTDGTGVLSWVTAGSGSLPSGTAGQTLRHNGTTWIANSFLYNDGTKIGIGKTNPAQTFDLVGTVGLEDTTASNKGVIYKGTAPFIHNFHHPTGDTAVPDGHNTFIGENAGNFTMGSTATLPNEGSYNIGIGYISLNSITTGSYNTAIGVDALYLNTTGSSNTAIGAHSLNSNTVGIWNTAIGESPLVENTTGSYNTAIGVDALYLNTTGSSNAAVGVEALYSTTGDYNTAVGRKCLTDLQSGVQNTAIGYNTGLGILTGSYNTIVGANITGLASTLSNNIIIADGQGNRRINVNASGYVGLGTITNASYLLHLSSDSAGKPGTTTWQIASDARLKDKGLPYIRGLKEIMQINPTYYKYKKNNVKKIEDDREFVGIIAQEIKDVIPEAVLEDKEGYLSYSADPTIWAMLNAIKELKTENDNLRTEINSLKEEIVNIKQIISKL